MNLSHLHNTHHRPHNNDLRAYNADMQRGLGSKLFFLDHLPIEAPVTQFVDFGCADGSLLKALHSVYPKAEMIGVDNDPRQLKAALKNFPEVTDLVIDHHFASPDEGETSALIMSSVIHEVISSAPRSFPILWRDLEAKGFDFIAIRDFAVSSKQRLLPIPDAYLEAVLNGEPKDRELFLSFSRRYPCTTMYDFMHFLLKRPYASNWKHEMEENYLALDFESLHEEVTRSGLYRVAHMQKTRTQHFVDTTMRDLGFVPDIPTHAEIVLVRADWYPEKHGEVSVAQGGQPVYPRAASRVARTWRAWDGSLHQDWCAERDRKTVHC